MFVEVPGSQPVAAQQVPLPVAALRPFRKLSVARPELTGQMQEEQILVRQPVVVDTAAHIPAVRMLADRMLVAGMGLVHKVAVGIVAVDSLFVEDNIRVAVRRNFLAAVLPLPTVSVFLKISYLESPGFECSPPAFDKTDKKGPGWPVDTLAAVEPRNSPEGCSTYLIGLLPAATSRQTTDWQDSNS